LPKDRAMSVPPITDRRNAPRRLAARRDEPVKCPTCGKSVVRKSRTQIYCSVRCQRRGRYADRIAAGAYAANWASGYHPSGDGRNPLKNASAVNDLHGQKSRPTSAFAVPLNVIGGRGHRWPGAGVLGRDLVQRIIDIEALGRLRCPSARTDAPVASANGAPS
jgi:hypothetical protein